MNETPKVALISEELLHAIVDVLPSEIQARVMTGRSKDGELVTCLHVDGCKCCEGPR